MVTAARMKGEGDGDVHLFVVYGGGWSAYRRGDEFDRHCHVVPPARADVLVWETAAVYARLDSKTEAGTGGTAWENGCRAFGDAGRAPAQAQRFSLHGGGGRGRTEVAETVAGAPGDAGAVA
ncbi:hypothetical protein B4109_0621 [Geobacillus stearothermophilus]|uniref:Uncharacterized protein n=1 Tax=Geobacillus stearothermophilus TaxID=1422 RepID=A0A150MS44_GEOSE|nr:hypothetical protein B4109_0621 [Geobacillus stearothermophilus]